MTAQAREEGTQKEQVSNPLVFVDDPYKFNLFLLEGRLQHLKDSNTLGKPVCFFDRGIGDVLAYMDFFDQEYGQDFEAICTQNRYDKIFMLPPWEEIYVMDNERLETFAEAEDLHHHLMETYQKFGYDPIVVPKAPVGERLQFVIDHLNLG